MILLGTQTDSTSPRTATSAVSGYIFEESAVVDWNLGRDSPTQVLPSHFTRTGIGWHMMRVPG